MNHAKYRRLLLVSMLLGRLWCFEKLVGEVEAPRRLRKCAGGTRRLLKVLGMLQLGMKIVKNDDIYSTPKTLKRHRVPPAHFRNLRGASTSPTRISKHQRRLSAPTELEARRRCFA